MPCVGEIAQKSGIFLFVFYSQEDKKPVGLQLKELQRKRRQSYKAQPEAVKTDSGEGVVKSIYPFESYGFIVTPQGREIYFHENSLKDISMNQLSEGDGVKFGEAQGDKGPCATWVKLAK